MNFSKMHGLGNDFIVLDGINQTLNLSPARISQLAARHTGIGFDQCLVVEASTTAGIDFTYRIFNADGQEVGQCGNGARCLALFIKQQGLSNKQRLTVATKTTQMNLLINADDSVTVDMGVPKSNPATIPFVAEKQQATYALALADGAEAQLHTISLGNPHAVLLVNDLDSAPVEKVGQQISEHPRFPQQTNTGFMQIINPQHIRLRVYERGCGETQACGSGAVAAAAVGRLYHNMAEQITVSLRGGDLVVSWPQLTGPISLTGPATFVYDGVIID